MAVHFLKNRLVYTDVLGQSACRKINRGTGQGLVLTLIRPGGAEYCHCKFDCLPFGLVSVYDCQTFL